ncbi:MAG: type II secretion system protein [Bdellovibrionales bacterium]|nr:type II secretion system protein [Bdellovibrionales bacterium]
MNNREKGFTLIEILMVLVLVGILAAVAINSFINFRDEARTAALQSNLAAVRAGIAAQYSQMQLRCNAATGTFPPTANLVANNITNGATPCTTAQVTIATEREFVSGGIPVSPWDDTQPPQNTVTDCVATGGGGAACTKGDATGCGGAATFSEAWCYNPGTGDFWMDSATAAREAL